MKKFFLLFFIILFESNIFAGWTITIHNNTDETISVGLGTTQNYPCTTGSWYCYIGGCWCNCAPDNFNVPPKGTASHTYSGVCDGACTSYINIYDSKGVKVADQSKLIGGLTACSSVDVWTGKNPDGTWFLSTSNLGHTQVLKNNTPWVVNVYLDEATCKNDCWYSIQPGTEIPLNTGLCCVQAITWWATDENGNFKGGSSGRFDMLCKSANWSIDKVGTIEGQTVYDIRRL